MPSVIKTREVSVQNYESNVFNESNENINFFGTGLKDLEVFENLDSNKRVIISYSVLPTINKEKRTKSVNGLENNFFSDQNLNTVNVVEYLSPKISFGIFNVEETKKEFDSNRDEISDIDNLSINLIGEDIQNPSGIYPFIIDYNANEIKKRGCVLDPLNIYNEITRDVITEFNEKGFKTSLSNSGSFDCRKRAINIINFYSKNNKTIEPFDDQGEIDDIMKVFDKQSYYENNFILVSLVNNEEKYSIDQNKKRYKSITSKETRYLSNEENDIEPFVEKDFELVNEDTYLKKEENRFLIKSSVLKEFFLNKDKSIMKTVYNDNVRHDVKYSTSGFANDYSKTHGIESIVFRGLIR